MKEAIRILLHSVTAPATARNLLREYLQARVLESLQHAGAMTSIAFHGETALRFLYAILEIQLLTRENLLGLLARK